MKACVISLLLLACLACKSEPSASEREAAIGKAQGAFTALGAQLKTELIEGMRSGNAAGAVAVCNQRAPIIAQQVSQRQGFRLGRSSHRLRNASNKPQNEPTAAAVEQYLSKHAGKKAAEVPVAASFEQGSWTVIAPIGIQPVCLGCHGNKESFTPELQAKLSAHYPADQATGFELGELRGVFWATLPRSSANARN